MRVKVTINDRTYDINCGSGNQDLAWLAMSAAYLYGKEVYPRGCYQPTLLIKSESRPPHPRSRISFALKDGEEVTVILKDPAQPQPKKHVKWYKNAYGENRNKMKVEFRYSPKNINFNTGNRLNATLYFKYSYTMFKELEDEFDSSLFPASKELELKPDEKRENFTRKIYLPYGEMKKLKICESYPQYRESPDGVELKDVPLDKLDIADFLLTPEPWSKKLQKEAMIKEEQEHKKREEEAIKKAQEQVQRVESNPAVPVKTLYDVWPDAPSALAPHFPLLYDVFSIYANFHLPDEDMMSAHDFFHFLRAFELIADSDDLIQIIIELGDDIESARIEVLKPKITLSHFLVLLVKFAEIRNPEDTAFNNLIEAMSKSKVVWLQDFVKAEIIKPEISELFMENCEDLVIRYMSKATRVEGIALDMKVNDFISMVLECEQLNDVINQEQLKRICDDTLFFSTFKDSQILYPDFLENLVRLAQIVPFNEDEIKQAFSNQSDTVILAEKLHSIIRILCGNKAPPSATGSRGLSRGKF